jgi:hypothetical protein
MAIDNSADMDYAAAYDSLRRRIASSYAAPRANLNQQIATRGVQGSGVATIPAGRMMAAQAGEESGLAQQIAARQAGTNVQDRQLAAQMAHQEELAQMGFDMRSSLQRSLAGSQLQGAVIGGGLSAAGSLAAGYMSRPSTPAINQYAAGKVQGDYGQYGGTSLAP